MNTHRSLRCPPVRREGMLVSITPAEAGWHYIHFTAHRLADGQELAGETEDRETALVILGGRAIATADGHTLGEVGEREDVWERTKPYAVLLPPGVSYTLRARGPLHVVVAAAPAERAGAPRLITPADIVAEERGAGQTARFIHHILPPAARASRLILVEVYTPPGNWSSFPPHKHDTEDPPRESYLEEVYYYQIRPATGFALQRVYTADRSLDQAVACLDGDLILVPRGYHVVAATPGHDCYYLNVMAGPTRAWNFQVDPDYAHLMNWQKPEVAQT
ncbi:MAG: 5-deoxy-glucuronate isomerase [Chloroflexi bacterium]|nr:5-deoxy-glucuronate isomerase [Chloroflexota bacterium]